MRVIAPTFSESWHRVAAVKASLRPTVKCRRQKLPSAALSRLAGGEVITSDADSSGLTSTEPLFLIYAEFDGALASQMKHGQSSRFRLTMGAMPLLSQLYRELRQLLQKRYQI
jgi:hypothetical protein